jgi:hypothetical protein
MGAMPSEQGDQWIDNRSRRVQDEAFCDAMYSAYSQGLEHPPRIGIDTRPCTQKPKILDVPAFLRQRSVD